MRAIVFALSLAACATAPTSAANFRLAGCWANRAEGRAQTMTWREVGAGLEGELVASASDNSSVVRQQFTLAQAEAGWRLCETSVELAPCWAVAHENTGSLEGGRAFIDRFGDRLRIGVVGADGVERKIFEGEREACPA